MQEVTKVTGGGKGCDDGRGRHVAISRILTMAICIAVLIGVSS